jgi:hypothetical protein
MNPDANDSYQQELAHILIRHALYTSWYINIVEMHIRLMPISYEADA